MRSRHLRGFLGALALAACSSSPSIEAPPPWSATPPEALCPEGFADCDGDRANGCEAALQTSLESCGACGARCAGGDGAAALCAAGACVVACDAGRADCDGEAESGCEARTLDDARHCGACGVVCSAACWNGTCDAAVLAEALPLPTFLEVDTSGLYWSNQGANDRANGSIMRLDPGGGTAMVLAADLAHPGHLALDEAAVYFSHEGGIAAVPKAGGEPTELAPGARGVAGLAVDQGTLYWVEAGTPPAFEDGGLFAAPLDPGAEPTKVKLATVPGFASGIALDADHVYVTAAGTGEAQGAIYRVARDGIAPSAPEGLHDKLDEPRALRAHGGAFWFIEREGIATFSPGTPVRRVVSDLPQTPAQLAFDDTRVYWTTAREIDGQVQSARFDGTDLATRARNLGYPWGIAVDGSNVYWTLAWAGGPMTGALVSGPKVP
ncbi:hypothetical protein SOCE26_040360 [Sorangium cellulosum]|uniref:4Fe-4S ferredoxin-type domain-containing protein n=1 Tax=Sorangium cellulosum TaxID=56 RepID=A0A2L0ETI4_SORCE|nr:hypothetical protein [Sorangium cellulosum]AUX42603.1 hypothetical protein SOCE26_040360 [Sorangium cellulosum]